MNNKINALFFNSVECSVREHILMPLLLLSFLLPGEFIAGFYCRICPAASSSCVSVAPLFLWRSWKRIAAPFKAQGRSLALSGNCSQWSPTCNICWSDKIWQGWNCLGMYWLTWNLVSFSSWRWKRVFTDKMQEVEFHKEGCHCDCSCYYIVVGTDECPEQLCFGGSS